MKATIALQIDFMSSLEDIWSEISSGLPKVFGFIGFVLLTWVFIKVLLYVVKKALNKTKIDEWSKRLSKTEIFGNTTINIVLTTVILSVLKWLLVLIFILIGADIFGLNMVSEGIGSFIAYLPRLLTSLLIFVGGVYVGTLSKKAIHSMFKSLDLTGGNLVANIAFYLIVVFISIAALDQAGIDTSILKSNLTLIIGSILLSFTIAFGLGSRDVIKRLLFGYYSRKNFEIGDRIKVKDIEGVIVAIDNICIVVLSRNGKVVLPIKEIVDEIVTIKQIE
ncbi:MAG: mechanosensitive ion channel [Flavobacteriaceae bacterium]|nr:mechanosensitive ion channel [Flavobacteriaceae bacterium]